MLSKIARWLLRKNESFKKLDKILSHPNDWEYDYYRITHNTRIAFWVCNGRTFFKIDKPKCFELPILFKLALWDKAKLIIEEKEYGLKDLLKDIKLDDK